MDQQQMEQLATELVRMIMTSSMPVTEQDKWVAKIQEGTLTEQDLDYLLPILEQDLEALKYAKEMLERKEKKGE